ncbi:MAG: aminotransferase class I/II-fold pyridoxal phosphate-dependent enzyme [Actinomycetes bacterium]|nr:aminotransferase class I/II-fold pyridoxal phosphate-dependent enzyme [Acidimicrobiia bacterium]
MSPTANDQRPRPGLKWNFYGADVLPAWVAEMDFGLAPEIAAALHAAVDDGEVTYPHPELMARTARAAVSFWADRLGWHVDPERVFPAPNVIEGVLRAIVHLTRPGSPVVLHTPVYHPFFSMVERAGRQVAAVRCRPDADGRYRLDLDGIAAAFDAGAGSIVLCNPWNPTARVFEPGEVEDLVQLAADRGARVIADEVHAPLIRSDLRHTVAATIDPDVVVTVTSASKAWNIPGLKCAQVVLTRDEDAEKWAAYFTSDKIGVATLGLVGNAAAYADARGWLDETVERIDANRRLLADLVAENLPGVRLTQLEGTYLAWLDFTPLGLDQPADYFLAEARVALNDGAPFGPGGEGHVRLNFATYPDILIEIATRMGVAAKKLGE